MAFNPLAAALDAQTKTLETAADATRRGSLLPERLEEMENIEVGQTPANVVYEENKLQLLQYESQSEEQNEVPILIVYALINKPYILDLQPNRSVVKRLLEAGHDVYMIDWNEPSRLDQHLTLYDYINRYIENSVDVVRERSGQDAINILGYCMGATMSTVYSALNPEKVNALGLMAPPLYFERSGGVLESWGSEEHFDPQDIVDTYGNVPADLLDDGFALMDPVDNYVSKYITLYENLESDSFIQNFARMERWLDEGIDLAGQAYVEFLQKIYQGNDLYRNEFELNGETVDINNLEMPIIMIMGEYDHLVPPQASEPFLDVVPSDDVTTIKYPTGHIGLSVSSSSHRDVWPEVCDWFHEKSAPEEDVAAEVEEIQKAAAATVGDGTAGESQTEADDSEAAAEAADTETDAETDETTTDAEASDTGADADIETVNGIGPTYADRLRAAGIETAADLAGYDIGEVADLADTSESRARGWLDQVE